MISSNDNVRKWMNTVGFVTCRPPCWGVHSGEIMSLWGHLVDNHQNCTRAKRSIMDLCRLHILGIPVEFILSVCSITMFYSSFSQIVKFPFFPPKLKKFSLISKMQNSTEEVVIYLANVCKNAPVKVVMPQWNIWMNTIVLDFLSMVLLFNKTKQISLNFSVAKHFFFYGRSSASAREPFCFTVPS